MSNHIAFKVVTICIIVALVTPALVSSGVPALAYSGVTPTVIVGENVSDFAISRDGDWIAYAEQNTDTIHIEELEGSSESTITLQNGILFYGDGSTMEYSLDDEWLFISVRNYTDDRVGLAKVRVTGAEFTWVYNHTRYFSLSHDGTQIVHITEDTNFKKLIVTDIDGNTPQEIFELPSYYDWISSTYWSPNGSRIAFHVWYDGGTDIWMVNPDGTNLQFVTNTSSVGITSYDPQWSPDSNWLVYWSGTDSLHGLWVIRPDGSDRFPLFSGRCCEPKFYPLGDKIIFRSYDLDFYGLCYIEVPNPITLFDQDRDQLSNFEEFTIFSTDVTLSDSDGDALGDAIEPRIGLNPLLWDSDLDGIGDSLEFIANFGVGAEVLLLPDDFLRITISWDLYTPSITANCTILGAIINATVPSLAFRVNQSDGGLIDYNLSIPVGLISSLEDTTIEIDGEVIAFASISVDDFYYFFFSTSENHEIVSINLGTSEPTSTTTTETTTDTTTTTETSTTTDSSTTLDTTTTTSSDTASTGTTAGPVISEMGMGIIIGGLSVGLIGVFIVILSKRQ